MGRTAAGNQACDGPVAPQFLSQFCFDTTNAMLQLTVAQEAEGAQPMNAEYRTTILLDYRSFGLMVLTDIIAAAGRAKSNGAQSMQDWMS